MATRLGHPRARARRPTGPQAGSRHRWSRSRACEHLLDDLPLPERSMIARVPLGGMDTLVASFHAPPGVNWGLKKPEQGVGFARWLSSVDWPVIFGADANTPLLDAPDFALTRTHWHTGSRRLGGAPRDDLLVGPDKIHELDDVLRLWLADHAAEMADIMATSPDGAAAGVTSNWQTADGPGSPVRFDSIWVSHHLRVLDVGYPYDACADARSEHSAVVLDPELHPPGSAVTPRDDSASGDQASQETPSRHCTGFSTVGKPSR